MISDVLVGLLLAGGLAIWLWALGAAIRRRSLIAFVLVFVTGPIGALVYVLIVVTAPPAPPPPGPPPLT